jgi:sporulation integral membrane protein YlbJ
MPIGKSLNSNQLKSNKKLFTKAGIVLFLAIILLFPAASYQGAKKGLLLWFNTILPTLLPFIIISNLIIKLQIHKSLSKLFYPIFHLLFGVSEGGCYPILIGFLSGYPVGAKSTADLVTNGIIDEEEGQFLLSLCNNVSPMFVMSYIAIAQLDMEHIRISLLLIIYLSSILSAMLYFKLLGKPKKQIIHTTSVEGKVAPLAGPKFDFALLDSAIMDGFEVITKVGGYIILFSIPAQILSDMSFGGGLFKILSVGFLEITTGINQLSHTNIDLNIKIALIAMVTAFGGLSGLAQTKSVISNSRLSIGTYFKVKIINMLFALLLTIFYVRFML